MSAPRGSRRRGITLGQLRAQSSGGPTAGESLGAHPHPHPIAELRLGKCARARGARWWPALRRRLFGCPEKRRKGRSRPFGAPLSAPDTDRFLLTVPEGRSCSRRRARPRSETLCHLGKVLRTCGAPAGRRDRGEAGGAGGSAQPSKELKGGDVGCHASLGRLCAANKKCVSACQSVTASGPSVQLSPRALAVSLSPLTLCSSLAPSLRLSLALSPL